MCCIIKWTRIIIVIHFLYLIYVKMLHKRDGFDKIILYITDVNIQRISIGNINAMFTLKRDLNDKWINYLNFNWYDMKSENLYWDMRDQQCDIIAQMRTNNVGQLYMSREWHSADLRETSTIFCVACVPTLAPLFVSASFQVSSGVYHHHPDNPDLHLLALSQLICVFQNGDKDLFAQEQLSYYFQPGSTFNYLQAECGVTISYFPDHNNSLNYIIISNFFSTTGFARSPCLFDGGQVLFN